MEIFGYPVWALPLHVDEKYLQYTLFVVLLAVKVVTDMIGIDPAFSQYYMEERLC